MADWHLGAESTLALSPDGTTLAIGASYAPVRIYRVPSGERLRLAGPTHVDDLSALWFSADSKVLHSTGYDDLGVDWDAETLKPLGVWPIEPHYAPKWPSRELTEPYRLGDGRNLQFLFPIDGSSLKLPVSITDAAGGKVIKQRDVDLPWMVESNEQGLVPGGRYFYLETQIYDLETLEFVAGRRMPGCHVYSITFSADGSRYAVAALDSRRDDMKCLRVVDTLSSKTLWYAEPKSDKIWNLVLSPDGKKLAWYDGSSIQVQQLP